MWKPAVLALTFAGLMLLTAVDGLSPPVVVDLPLSGSPSRIDSDGKEVVAISFRDRNVLGIYYAAIGSYVEVNIESPALMTAFSQNTAIALLNSRDRLALVDVISRKTTYLSLESAASSIAAGETGVYVVFPRGQRVDRIDLASMTVAESFSVRPADGLDHVSVYGRTLYVVSHNLDEVMIFGERTASIKTGGVVVLVRAVRDGAWVVLSDDTVLKISGSSIVSRTSLPRATFVSSASTIESKLVYGSVSRRVVGIVDGGGFRESSTLEASPLSVTTGGKRIWVLDGLQQKVWLLYDSVAPRLSDWRVEALADRSAVVRVKASDPDNDLKSVELIPIEYQGIYSIKSTPLPMTSKQGFFEATYRPGPDITRVELYVNATDVAGNSVSAKVGELDYTRSPTSPQVTTVATAPPSDPAAATALVSELLLLVPLVIVVTVLLFARKTRRKKTKKR
ncbi:MAG: hypothetical protein N3H84_03080 [Candidatus Caldarchaeum sp.]|nr:hypothetical protein [Candidatus Caldarchaeum sp.]